MSHCRERLLQQQGKALADLGFFLEGMTSGTRANEASEH